MAREWYTVNLSRSPFGLTQALPGSRVLRVLGNEPPPRVEFTPSFNLLPCFACEQQISKIKDRADQPIERFRGSKLIKRNDQKTGEKRCAEALDQAPAGRGP